MIKYIKGFKEFIPTWIICIFMFFGVFGWTFLIGLFLLVIQILQRRDIKKEFERYENEFQSLQNKMNEHSITESEIQRKKLIIKELDNEFDEEKGKRLVELAKCENMIEKLNEELDRKEKERAEEIAKELKQKYENMDEELKRDYYEKTKKYKKEEEELRETYKYMNKELENAYNTKIKRYERQIEDIKEEIDIINSDCIEKYYCFSDYENMTSEDCKNELTILKQEEKELRDSGRDIEITDIAEVDKRTIRQILRNFNMECDNIILNTKINNIDKSRNKIQKSFDTINKLYSYDGVEISKELLELKLKQISLMYTSELKQQQEKEIQKAIKEQMIEEAKAQKEIEEQKKKIDKDLQQHLGEINRMMKYMQKTKVDAEKQLYIDKIKELEDRIKELETDKETVLEREANAKAGYVYIISNIGSFGEDIYKIGMTRRLEPMDRIKELSSASVPFEFDVHAMIFSSDAPELENTLHKHFADKAVNKVNPRKEFYNVDIDEIEKVVKENYNDTVQFTKIPIATEYRQSISM